MPFTPPRRRYLNLRSGKRNLDPQTKQPAGVHAMKRSRPGPITVERIESISLNKNKCVINDFERPEHTFFLLEFFESPFSEFDQLSGSEKIYVEPGVFGSTVEHMLMQEQGTKCIDKKLKAAYKRIHKQIGLPLDGKGNLKEDKAKVGLEMESLTFGCRSFPDTFIKNTLSMWHRRNDCLLINMFISWKIPLDKRSVTIENLGKDQNISITHIWSSDKHDRSPFVKAEIGTFKNHNVDIFFMISEDRKRAAVLSISDYAIHVDFGSNYESGIITLLKTTFYELTGSADTYFEINLKKHGKLFS